MIDINNYAEKVDIASQQKVNPNYRNAIKTELSKPDWQQRKFELDRLVANIKDSQDFERYQKALSKLFDDLYEVITAPGVDDFIGLLNSIIDNKNDTNAKKLRKFLVQNYSENFISEPIDSILSCKDSLNIENSVLSTLLTEIKKILKKECNEFLNKPDEFENNVKEFLNLLSQRLEDFHQTPELKYTQQKEFYTPEQSVNNIAWYEEIIEKVIEINQSLKPIDKVEEDLGSAPATKTKKRIADIRACIKLLDNSGMANLQDSVLKNTFQRFVLENIKYLGGVKNNLDEFFEKKWADIEENYELIDNFFEKNHNIEYKNSWDAFPQKENLQALILSYKSIVKENPLRSLQNQKSTLAIQQILTKKVAAINDFISSTERLKTEILELFGKTIKEYQEKNLPLLDNLSLSNNALISIIIEIKEQIEGLNNGINSLKNASDIIIYIAEYFTYDLNSLTDISNMFKKSLQESRMSDHLNWLEAKLNGSDSDSLNSADFDNSQLMKELLEKGLIKIIIQKQF